MTSTDTGPRATTEAEAVQSFKAAVASADRVLVETKNALGEYDVNVFQASTARAAMPSPDAGEATHWAITSPTGTHIGLWDHLETAQSVFNNELNGSTLTPMRALTTSKGDT